MIIRDGRWHLGGHKWVVMQEVAISGLSATLSALAEIGVLILARADPDIRALCGARVSMTCYDDPGSALGPPPPVGRVIELRGLLIERTPTPAAAAARYALAPITAYRETLDGAVVRALADDPDAWGYAQ